MSEEEGLLHTAAYEAPITLSDGEIVGQVVNRMAVIEGDASTLAQRTQSFGFSLVYVLWFQRTLISVCFDA